MVFDHYETSCCQSSYCTTKYKIYTYNSITKERELITNDHWRFASTTKHTFRVFRMQMV